ncbi:PREDICTED: acyl-CoA desaturase-like [Branchiostoma belcheri]|uniref:Acyl-CoA desaturase-like n=1 Tax=Branchiostoma belcheri TaxID=7741 RepID=A0A6P4Z0X6_BRABE|nr:PREDICTED: acyl-CoA desaturase-like [Branchiostoma belcheri]
MAPTESSAEVRTSKYSWNGEQKQPHGQPVQIVWRNVVFMSLLHLGAVYGLVLLPQAHIYTAVWAILLHYFSGVLGITAGAHRLWAHRTYKARLPLRVVMAMANSVAFQNHIHEWSRDHRCHHKYSETNGDPHNASRGFFFSHCGWLLVRKHPDVIAKGKQIDLSDLAADPVVRFQKRYYLPSVLLLCFTLPTVVPILAWRESLTNAFCIAVLSRYVLTLNATWLVNSAAHLWGTRPYDRSIRPAENRFVSSVAGGEGWHNYHHTFPFDYATGELGWRLNMTTVFIDLMAWAGLAYDLRTAPPSVVRARALRTGDGTWGEQY